MMKIYSTSDRITVQIDELVFKLAPLSYKQKIEIQTLFKNGQEAEGSIKCLKYSIKDIQGVECSNGDQYKIKFDDSGLDDSCIDDILNLEISSKLQLACATLINGVPKEIVHPVTGKALEGVKIVNPFQKQDTQN